jgi:tRNA G10  N-methylase Trm11
MVNPSKSPQHPARFSDDVLECICTYLRAGSRVLDPFAGTGKLARIDGIEAMCVELEPEWATDIVGNALHLPLADETFHTIATSPCYGNRMADHHNAKDASRRHTYRHDLGRMPSKGSAAVLQWGDDYRNLHIEAWLEAVRVLRADGRFVLNIKDHIRGGIHQHVSDWHLRTLLALGLRFVTAERIGTPGQRHGANSGLLVGYESLLVLEKP